MKSDKPCKWCGARDREIMCHGSKIPTICSSCGGNQRFIDYKGLNKQFNNTKTKIEGVLTLALLEGQTGGIYHKMWVIDSMLRILAGDAYEDMIDLYESSGRGKWEVGFSNEKS